MIKKVLVLFGVLACMIQASPIFSSGSGVWGSSNLFSYNNVFVAEDFHLSNPSTIDKIVFNALTVNGVTLPITEVQWKFYADNSGSVGTELFSGNSNSITDLVTGNLGSDYILRDYYVDIADVTLGSGIYWMGLSVDPAQWDMHWTIPLSDTYGSLAQSGNATGDPTSYSSSYEFHHTFRLEGQESTNVPEPTTISMLLLGISLLGIRFRSSRKKNR